MTDRNRSHAPLPGAGTATENDIMDPRRYSLLRAPRRPGPLLPLLAAAVLGAAGCDSLLDVAPNPDTVGGEQIDNPTSLPARLVGVEADFFFSFDQAIALGGLFADELIDGTGLDEIDERRVTADNGLIGSADEAPEGIDGLWTPLQRTAFVSNQLQEDLLAGKFSERVPDPANSPELARVSLFAGYSKLVLGELFCSTAFNGTGPEFTSQETFALAEEEFTQAIQAAGAPAQVRFAALLGRARARLQQGDLEGARADASQIPTDFLLLADVFSNNSQKEENDIWNMLTDSQRFSVAPEFRFLTIDDTEIDDPRVEVFQDPNDPTTSNGTELFQAAKYLSPTAPIRFATGDEAQLILAEVALRSGDVDAAVERINAVRARNGITVEFQSDDPAVVARKLLEERGRTLFLEGQRVGDLRRFIDVFGINGFPTGEGFGDQTCFPLPDAERNNNPDI
jgi:hypothetical protein